MKGKYRSLVFILLCITSPCFSKDKENLAWDYFVDYVESKVIDTAIDEAGKKVVEKIFEEALAEKINDNISATEVLSAIKGIEALADGDLVTGREEIANLIVGHFVPNYGAVMGMVQALHTSGEAILENWIEDLYDHPSYHHLRDLINRSVVNGYASGDPYLPSHYCRSNEALRHHMRANEDKMFESWSNDPDTINLLVKGGYAARLRQKLGKEPDQRQIFHHFLIKISNDQKSHFVNTFQRAYARKAALRTQRAILARAQRVLPGPATDLSLKIEHTGDVLKAGRKFTVRCFYSLPWATKHLLKVVIKTPSGEIYADKMVLGRVWRAGSHEHPITFNGLGNHGHYTIDFYVDGSGIASLEGFKLRVQPDPAFDEDGESNEDEDDGYTGPCCIVYLLETPPGTYPQHSVALLMSRQVALDMEKETDPESIQIHNFDDKRKAVEYFLDRWSGMSFHKNWDEGFINCETGRVDVDGSLLSEIREHLNLAPLERKEQNDAPQKPPTSGTSPAQEDPVLAILINRPWMNTQVQAIMREFNRAEGRHFGVPYVDDWGLYHREGYVFKGDPPGSYENPFHYQWLTKPAIQKYVELRLRNQPIPPDFLTRHLGPPKSAVKSKEKSYLDKLTERRQKKEPSYLDKLQQRTNASREKSPKNKQSYLDKLANVKKSSQTTGTKMPGSVNLQSSDMSRLNGSWRGQITEKGQSTSVELDLQVQKGRIDGVFLILGSIENNMEGAGAFKIAQVGYTGNNLTFIVPISGKIDEDALSFTLRIEGDLLKGHLIERRQGSKSIFVTLKKSSSKSSIPGTKEEIGRLLAQCEHMTQELKRRAESGLIKADNAEAEAERFFNEYMSLLQKAIAGVEKLCNHDKKKSEALFEELVKQYAPEMYEEMEKTRREALRLKEENDRHIKEMEQKLKELESQ